MSEPTVAREHEYVFINAFRALAAFWVLAYHCMIWGGMGTPLLPSAKIAVDLFMMISGFLMAANATARQRYEPISEPRTWLRFYTRRFFRIAPVYYFALVLVFTTLGTYKITGLQELQTLNPHRWPAAGTYQPAMDFSLDNFLMHASFLFGLHPEYARSVRLPDWSIGLEMQFYMVFPLLFLLMQRAGVLRIGLFVGILSMISGVLVERFIPFPEPSLLLLKFEYFIAGILMFGVLNGDRTDVQRIGLAAGVIGLVSLEISYGWEVVCLPLLALAMLGIGWLETRHVTPALIARVLDSRLVRFASNTSYAVYLMHGFFIAAGGLILANHRAMFMALPSATRVVLLFVLVTLCSYTAAYLIFRLIEVPGIELGKRLLKRRRLALNTV